MRPPRKITIRKVRRYILPEPITIYFNGQRVGVVTEHVEITTHTAYTPI